MADNSGFSHVDLRTLSDLSIYNCRRFGPYTAIIYEDRGNVREYTNMDIAREAAQLAAGLRALGVQKGDRVIVMMINSPEVIIAYQAIARAGAIIIPVMPLLKAPEVRYIAENSAARAVITSVLLLPMVCEALADVPIMQHIISTGNPADKFIAPENVGHHHASPSSHPHISAYSEVVASGQAAARDFLSPSSSASPDDIGVILYTSGTTGRPKGVVLSHRSLLANAISGRGPERVVRDQETQLAILPLAHAFGILAANVFFLRGVTTVADKYDTSSLQSCVSGSAPLPVAILEAFEQKFGCRILEGYGLSEASAALTGHTLDIERRPGSVGKPLPGVELRVVDENDQPVPVGEVGEVIARGSNVMQGYYNMPEETQTVLRNGWLHTGDMGRLDEDGYLYIVERKKDLIIRGGFNVYPRDVEEVLNRHPAVIESAVIGIPSERMGEDVKAFVVTREPVDAEILKAFCQASLANYKTPSEIEFINMLPRNAVGKIDKKELRSFHVH